MPKHTKPNIIYFFTDQQRWDTVGCYGQPLDVTPNMDRLASEGVRFEHAFTCQPVCGPARACIQTGKYATEIGCYRNDIALPLDQKTIAHWMTEAGYEVAYIGKWHLASTGGVDYQPAIDLRTSPVPLERRGGYKDHWVASDVLEFTSHGYDGYMYDGDGNKREFKGYRVDCHTDFVLEYLRNRTSDRPFFLFISYIEPHHQNDRNRYEGPDGSKGKYKEFIVPGDLADTQGDWRENYPDYLGQINSLDANLGRVRDELEAQGLTDDTLILLTSDHGSHFRTRNSEYKRSCHDGCIRIPMIASGPGFRGGRVVSELVSLIDMAPTVLAAGGIEVPYTMRGRPLQDLLGDAPVDWPSDVYLEISESQIGRAIRTKKWKYSVRAPDGQTTRAGRSLVYEEDFLYDLESDPHERNNLVSDTTYAPVRADLRERLIARIVAVEKRAPEIVDANA